MADVVGIVIGCTGFLFTTRNAVSRLLEDVHTVHHHANLLVQLAVRLKLSSHELEAWQKLWNLYDGCPSNLPRIYWGREYLEIQQVLGQIQNIAQNVKSEFYSKYKSDLRALNKQLRSTWRISDFNDTIQAEIVDDHLKRFKKRHSVLSRSLSALFVTPLLEKELQELENLIELLQRSSKRFFISRHAGVINEREEGWEVQVSYLSFRENFTRFADTSCDTSRALHSVLASADQYTIELYLDQPGEGSEARCRVQDLMKVVQTKSFKFHLTLSRKEQKANKKVAFYCSPRSSDHEMVCSYDECNLDFCSAAEIILGVQRTGRLHLHQPTNGGFLLQYPSKRKVAECKGQSLRSFLAASKIRAINFSKHLHGDFTLEERHRLAYELAEWTELFLKTWWFSDLCSCRLYRIEDDSGLQTYFTALVSINDDRHTDIMSNSDGTQPWCQRELVGMHIRRLGIILVEIAFGQPILDLRPVSGGGIEIHLEHESDPVVLDTIQRNEMVRRSMGFGYALVVDYCLRQNSQPGDIERLQIRDFHLNVVEPLFRYFRRHCDKSNK